VVWTGFIWLRIETSGGLFFVNLYSSPDIIRMIKSKEDEMARACSTHGNAEE
jgi:hypothetical protein